MFSWLSVRSQWLPALASPMPTAASMATAAMLNVVVFNFVGQASLGAPFQVDSARITEAKSTRATIPTYLHLMRLLPSSEATQRYVVRCWRSRGAPARGLTIGANSRRSVLSTSPCARAAYRWANESVADASSGRIGA
jgi:hypothetical protein